MNYNNLVYKLWDQTLAHSAFHYREGELFWTTLCFLPSTPSSDIPSFDIISSFAYFSLFLVQMQTHVIALKWYLIYKWFYERIGRSKFKRNEKAFTLWYTGKKRNDCSISQHFNCKVLMVCNKLQLRKTNYSSLLDTQQWVN